MYSKIARIWRKSKKPWPLLSALTDLCFPPQCLGCGSLAVAGDLRLCVECLARWPLLRHPICPACGVNFPNSGSASDHLCAVCRQQPWAFTKARALMAYDEQVARLIHAFKFRGEHSALTTFARLAKQSAVLADLDRPDLLVPVPLHPSRLRQRGFNQAAVLIPVLCPGQGGFLRHALQRVRATKPQKGLSGKERRRNVVGSFAVVDTQMVAGKKILLCDDVFTTGTTLNECAKTLRGAGAAQVEVVTLSRVMQR